MRGLSLKYAVSKLELNEGVAGKRKASQMKISIKWILVLTLIFCIHLSLSTDRVIFMIIVSALTMGCLLPAVATCRWSIADDDGWWKFQGSTFARIVVWCYAISGFNIMLGALRMIVFVNSQN